MEIKYRENAERINTEILREWATGKGKNPVSWKTLTTVLHDIRHSALASDIEEVKLVSVETPEEEVQLPLLAHSGGMCMAVLNTLEKNLHATKENFMTFCSCLGMGYCYFGSTLRIL